MRSNTISADIHYYSEDSRAIIASEAKQCRGGAGPICYPAKDTKI
jgi:hypothetical protein